MLAPIAATGNRLARQVARLGALARLRVQTMGARDHWRRVFERGPGADGTTRAARVPAKRRIPSRRGRPAAEPVPARQGPEGARRTVFIIGQDLPAGLGRRVERRHGLVRQADPPMDGVSGALSFVARLSV